MFYFISIPVLFRELINDIFVSIKINYQANVTWHQLEPIVTSYDLNQGYGDRIGDRGL